VKSETRKINIFVPLPYWKEPVFWIIVSLIIVGLSVWTFKFKEKQIRNKLDAQNQVEKQLASLEQKAIQAQMNPHFIFNSLNSIQQYILTNNVEDANKYLSIFAALIRETLENSSSGKISLNREIGYITKYLELERMRFGNTFDFIINANGLEMDTKIEFPVMLVQPYVENAVRHGMRYTTEGKGMIQIDFWRENNHIFCRIKDNGPGRAESFRIKSKQHIEYQSQGMNLTQRRVDILNTIFEEKILIEVKDIINEKGGVAGTEVQLTLTQITNETDD
jgi:LytS/YehU family sensor histidine kinase